MAKHENAASIQSKSFCFPMNANQESPLSGALLSAEQREALEHVYDNNRTHATYAKNTKRTFLIETGLAFVLA